MFCHSAIVVSNGMSNICNEVYSFSFVFNHFNGFVITKQILLKSNQKRYFIVQNCYNEIVIHLFQFTSLLSMQNVVYAKHKSQGWNKTPNFLLCNENESHSRHDNSIWKSCISLSFLTLKTVLTSSNIYVCCIEDCNNVISQNKNFQTYSIFFWQQKLWEKWKFFISVFLYSWKTEIVFVLMKVLWTVKGNRRKNLTHIIEWTAAPTSMQC